MYNKIILIGRTTADPEMRHTPNGTAVARFTLAVARAYKGQDGEKKTDFLDCVAWRGLAETVTNHVKKGYMLAIEGRMEIRPYDDKDGNRRKAYEVICENVRFLDRGKDGGQQTSGQGRFSDDWQDVTPPDDLPF
jgi:single-strand DNA-binding protein